jgi:hypothetical protein
MKRREFINLLCLRCATGSHNYEFREFVVAGSLISYGTSVTISASHVTANLINKGIIQKYASRPGGTPRRVFCCAGAISTA